MSCTILQMENQKVVWHGINPFDAVLYSVRIIFCKPQHLGACISQGFFRDRLRCAVLFAAEVIGGAAPKPSGFCFLTAVVLPANAASHQ